MEEQNFYISLFYSPLVHTGEWRSHSAPVGNMDTLPASSPDSSDAASCVTSSLSNISEAPVSRIYVIFYYITISILLYFSKCFSFCLINYPTTCGHKNILFKL